MSQRISPGSFFRINLPCRKYAYGRILNNANYVFYDRFSDEELNDLEDLIKCNILFTIAVHNSAINSGRWLKIGMFELDETLMVLPMKFIQDRNNLEDIQSYNSNTGEILASNYNACIGLERASVWDPEHVESRLCDHLAGRPNVWVERQKIQNPLSE